MTPPSTNQDTSGAFPTIRDRVIQTAGKLVIEPIFEADLEPNSYGYRPKQSARDAVRKVHELFRAGFADVVDADLSEYLDTIPHADLVTRWRGASWTGECCI